MGRFRSRGAWLAFAVFSLLNLVGCGSSKSGPPLFPGKINLNSATATSLTLGGVLGFTASAQTPTGTTLNVTITYTSSDTSILNVSPNGVACAGHWDGAFTTCTPGATGPAFITASALGASSVPTYVFVHPPIDNITVTGVVPNGEPVQEPCLSQSQSMTVEAHAFSQGSDITASVGPFTWSANNSTVVNLVPLPNTTFIPGTNETFNFATNQATATAAVPGMTYIFATASGVSSNSFRQPQITNSSGTVAPLLDFFSTCPIQNIALELGAAGSTRTTFATAKGTSAGQTVVATLMDIMGNSSLPNTDNAIVLSKIPLTWTSSQSSVISTAASCTQSCALSLPSPGTATVTASCSPPTCNVGYPMIPNSLSTKAKVDACTAFFTALYPLFSNCQELIPTPVYASPVFKSPNTEYALSPIAAISGLVTGAPTAPAVLASSNGCANELPSSCSTSAYSFSTAKASVGNENPLPTPPNSFLFSPSGDKVFMGSNFGAVIITPASFGTTSPPYTSLGTVTGTALAVSPNGTNAIISDVRHTPNQVYVVSSSNPAATTALNIPLASLASLSPDGLKAYIVGGSAGSSMYIYSPVQALQGPIALAGPAKSLGYSPNGAFLFVAASAGGGTANLTAYPNCTNPALAPIQPVASIPLPSDPLFMKVLPALHIDGKDSFGNAIPDGIHVLILDSTGVDIVTSNVTTPTAGTLCSQGLQFISGDPVRSVQRIELGQGNLQPVNFFYSTDGTQLYVVSSSTSSILVYSFITGSVTGGIELQNNATPLTADISSDSGTIIISGSDGMLHEVSTTLGGSDAIPLSFPNIPNAANPFCSLTPSAGPCALNMAIVKP